MRQPLPPSPIPRLALRGNREAAAACGVSEDHFATHIGPYVPCVRQGRLKLYPVAALERFLSEHSEVALEERTP